MFEKYKTIVVFLQQYVLLTSFISSTYLPIKLWFFVDGVNESLLSCIAIELLLSQAYCLDTFPAPWNPKSADFLSFFLEFLSFFLSFWVFSWVYRFLHNICHHHQQMKTRKVAHVPPKQVEIASVSDDE